MSAVWTLTLPPAEKLVLQRLAYDCHEDGRNAYPKVDTLAASAGISSRTVQRVLRGLVAKGLIAVQTPATRYKSTTYRLTLPPAAFSPAKRNMARGEMFAALEHFAGPIRGDKVSPLNVECGVIRGDTGGGSGVTEPCHPIRVQRSEEQEHSASAERSVETVENSDRPPVREIPFATHRLLVKFAHGAIGKPDEMQALKDALVGVPLRWMYSGQLASALAVARVQQRKASQKRQAAS